MSPTRSGGRAWVKEEAARAERDPGAVGLALWAPVELTGAPASPERPLP